MSETFIKYALDSYKKVAERDASVLARRETLRVKGGEMLDKEILNIYKFIDNNTFRMVDVYYKDRYEPKMHTYIHDLMWWMMFEQENPMVSFSQYNHDCMTVSASHTYSKYVIENFVDGVLADKEDDYIKSHTKEELVHQINKHLYYIVVHASKAHYGDKFQLCNAIYGSAKDPVIEYSVSYRIPVPDDDFPNLYIQVIAGIRTKVPEHIMDRLIATGKLRLTYDTNVVPYVQCPV